MMQDQESHGRAHKQLELAVRKQLRTTMLDMQHLLRSKQYSRMRKSINFAGGLILEPEYGSREADTLENMRGLVEKYVLLNTLAEALDSSHTVERFQEWTDKCKAEIALEENQHALLQDDEHPITHTRGIDGVPRRISVHDEELRALALDTASELFDTFDKQRGRIVQLYHRAEDKVPDALHPSRGRLVFNSLYQEAMLAGFDHALHHIARLDEIGAEVALAQMSATNQTQTR